MSHPDLTCGRELAPIPNRFGEPRTGFAFIYKCEPTHPELVELDISPEAYIIVTDFGNKFKMTKDELFSSYILKNSIVNPKERLQQQADRIASLLQELEEANYE